MRVLIAEDHPLFSEALSRVVHRVIPEPELEIVGDRAGLEAALKPEQPAGLVMLDYVLPGIEGPTSLELIRAAWPDVPVVVVSNYEDANRVRLVIDAGARGFVPKSATADTMVKALETIMAGGIYIPQSVIAAFTSGESSEGLHGLTRRQLQVLQEIALGRSNQDIADSLGIALSTVKLHVNAILAALGAKNRTEAALMAYRSGLVDVAATAEPGRAVG